MDECDSNFNERAATSLSCSNYTNSISIVISTLTEPTVTELLIKSRLDMYTVGALIFA